jgi:hypothetical protein
MKLMEDWQGDRQDISPKARLHIDLLIMALEQVEDLTRLSQNLAYLSKNEQLESAPIRQLEILIDAMNRARYRLQVLEADLKSGQQTQTEIATSFSARIVSIFFSISFTSGGRVIEYTQLQQRRPRGWIYPCLRNR